MTMETYLARQQRAANAQRARFLIEEWHDTAKPALDRIELAALAFLDALGDLRLDLLRATDIQALDGLACDTAGQTIDLLNGLAAAQRRELDDHGGDPNEMTLDLSELEASHRVWERRWDARRPG